MSVAEDLQQNAINNASDQSANAGAYANLVGQLATQLLNNLGIALPSWSSTGLSPPALADTSGAPSYSGAYTDPGRPEKAPDVMKIIQDAYDAADANTLNAVDSLMLQYSASQCPGYLDAVRSLEALLVEGESGPVSQAERAELLNWAETKADEDRKAAQGQVMAQGSNGFDLPQPSRVAQMNRIESAYNDAVAAQRTGIVVQTISLSAQTRQVVMQVKGAFTDAMRQSVLAYGLLVVQTKDHALKAAEADAGASAQGYKLSMEQFESWRAGALAQLTSGIEMAKIQVEAYRARIEGALGSNRLAIDSVSQQLAVRSKPYDGELQRNLVQRQTDVGAMEHVLEVFGAITQSFASIAASAESGINAIGSATTDA
jgi:hypothetical protein